MSTPRYCKRLRMEIDLAWIDPVPALPLGSVWVPWAEEVLWAHAEIMWRSFRAEFDTLVFPNMARRDGCVHLMQVIRDLPGFIPGATWLIETPEGCCGTVQGCNENGRGMIQNLGVVPSCRGFGFGRALLLKSLHGFRRAGLQRAYLEVSARNRSAIRLYHQTGFIISKTYYREITPVEEEMYVI